jgi:hypothetical protein
MPQQELHGSEVASAPIDKHGLGASQGVRAELRRIETNAGNPRTSLAY